MRKTNAELADFFGIKVGDIIEFEFNSHTRKVKCVSIDDDVFAPLVSLDDDNLGFSFSCLVNCEYKVIKRSKHVGDQMCGSFLKCVDCPLAMLLNCGGNWLGSDASLYQCLDEAFEKGGAPSSHPIYKAYKQLLDAEI